MKTLKQLFSISILLLSVIALLGSCSKKNDEVTPQGKNGSFIAQGTTYKGSCESITDVGTGGSSGNIDVAITTTSGSSFVIYNMPKQSNGTFNFADGYYGAGGSGLYAIFSSSSANLFGTKSGTVTKTGSSSFTFSCTVYDIVSNQSFSVTGNGSY